MSPCLSLWIRIQIQNSNAKCGELKLAIATSACDLRLAPACCIGMNGSYGQTRHEAGAGYGRLAVFVFEFESERGDRQGVDVCIFIYGIAKF